MLSKRDAQKIVGVLVACKDRRVGLTQKAEDALVEELARVFPDYPWYRLFTELTEAE
jgi:hypothetical protein